MNGRFPLEVRVQRLAASGCCTWRAIQCKCVVNNHWLSSVAYKLRKQRRLHRLRLSDRTLKSDSDHQMEVHTNRDCPIQCDRTKCNVLAKHSWTCDGIWLSRTGADYRTAILLFIHQHSPRRVTTTSLGNIGQESELIKHSNFIYPLCVINFLLIADFNQSKFVCKW